MVLDPKDEVEQDPTVYLWLLYFLAHHYYFCRNSQEGLKYIQRAIDHTPTLIDLYTLKGKLMKIAGNRSDAARLFEEARILDQADRAINALAACYQVKAGQVQKGEETIAIFFKDCGYESSVHDNQCLWFEQVCGKYQFRLGNYRESLKQYSHVMTHVQNMIED
jgi:peptide alpha-N-acetyltransferase